MDYNNKREIAAEI